MATEEAHQDRLRQRHEEDQRRPADGAISRERLTDRNVFKLENDEKNTCEIQKQFRLLNDHPVQ